MRSYKDNIVDDRGWITKARRVLPTGTVRVLRSASLWFFGFLPSGLKYRVAGNFQRHRYPYKLLNEGDRVVQVGAPWDILLAGRSRAVHFARAVGATGRVLIIEPDQCSVDAMRDFIETHGMSDRAMVVSLGAWNGRGTAKLHVNTRHPAANRVEGLERDRQETKTRDANEGVVVIQVDSLNNILQAHGFTHPKMISINTNGAEREILAGLWPGGEEFLPSFISLAPPNDANIEVMEAHGFRWVAWDDRGQLFERNF